MAFELQCLRNCTLSSVNLCISLRSLCAFFCNVLLFVCLVVLVHVRVSVLLLYTAVANEDWYYAFLADREDGNRIARYCLTVPAAWQSTVLASASQYHHFTATSISAAVAAAAYLDSVTVHTQLCISDSSACIWTAAESLYYRNSYFGSDIAKTAITIVNRYLVTRLQFMFVVFAFLSFMAGILAV